MKKKKILLIILGILIIIITAKYATKKQDKETILKDVKYKMGPAGTGATTYRDFGELGMLSSEYSYSSINYGPDTEFVLLNKRIDKFDYSQTDLSGELGYRDGRKGFAIGVRDEAANPKVLIKNCATDEMGRSLDVVVELSKYKSYSDTANNSIYLSTTNFITQETDPVRPLDAEGDDRKTERYIFHKIGSPITLGLNSEGAEIKFTMTYYIHPLNNRYPGGTRDYIYDINRLTKANVTKVNGYYYDIDITTGDYNNRNRPTIFQSSGNKTKFEGINPYLENGENATIYYNKYRAARFFTDDNNRRAGAPFRESHLAEDNGGIRIDDYTGEGGGNINSAWYGTSAFMTSDNLKNSSMSFYYGGNGCGIVYGFMSPVPYATTAPTKTVSKLNNQDEKLSKVGVNRNETIIIDVNQYIPNTYYTAQLNFDKVYDDPTNVYSPNVFINNLYMEDRINNNFEVVEAKVYNDSQDISDRFNIDKSNNFVRATLKSEYFDKIESYNLNYDLKIAVKLKDQKINSAPLQVQNGRVQGVPTKDYTISNPNALYLENNNEILVKNIARSEVTMGKGNNSNYSNIAEIRIMPEITHRIVKTGPEEVYDREERISHKIIYETKIENYIGNANLTITDVAPYHIKTNSNGNLGSDRRTIQWSENVNNINTLKEANGEKIIRKEIDFSNIYQDMAIESSGKFTNVAVGKTTLSTPEMSRETRGSCTTKQKFVIDVTASKFWEDLEVHGITRRPKKVQFLVLQNGKKTKLISPEIDTSKDTDSYTFKELPKYDNNGNRYDYKILEISKITDKDNYNLKNMKGDVVESAEDLAYYQDFMTKEEQDSYESGNRKKYIDITNKYTSINIKGNIWKDANINGKKDNEAAFKGIEVQLILETTRNNQKHYSFTGYNVRTNESGDYSFNDIPWNGTYKLRFLYNGQVYETTYYKDNLSGIYSNAKEYTDTRQEFNDKFATISAYPNNYDKSKRAFGVNQKIRNTTDYDYNFLLESTPYTFEDILKIFENVDLRFNDYNELFWETFESTMIRNGINETTASKINEYMQDCMMLADTPATYSEKNLAELKTGTDNTIENVSVGFSRREENNLSISNDVYKVTQILNGKIKEDVYDAKEEIYEVDQRAERGIYNGKELKARKLYKSDYLYNGDDIDEESNRNLQVFLTYRIKVKNNGRVSAKINSISNYYDSEHFEDVSSISERKTFKDNTFVGDKNFNKIGNIGIIEDDDSLVEHNYNKVIITGSEDTDKLTPINVYHESTNSVDDILHPEEELDVYITYKVKNDTITNRVFIDTEIKNIVEINGYSTVYTPLDNTIIPDRLDNRDNLVSKKIDSIVNAGVVDRNSDPGNLTKDDIDDNDNLIYKKTKLSKTYTNMEDDTDKIGFILQISQDKNDMRRIGGFVFEDERDYNNNKLKISIGNGYKENSPKDKSINGVTLQLVELIPEIDENGLAVIEKNEGRDTIKYKRELVIGTYNYIADEEGKLTKEGDYNDDQTDSSYYSGNGKSKIIETGSGQLEVLNEDIGNNGEYRFDSIYPGDFYVRFIYGDTVRTTLTNTDNAVNELLKDTEYKGLNEKSYNGQDYKSTIYQSAFDNKGDRIEIDQSGNYYGIDGFGYNNGTKDEGRYNTQNYALKTNIKDQKAMYYYDLEKSNNMIVNSNRVRVSDAKDIYDDRIKSTQYSLDLVNRNGEVLNSYNQLRSDLSGKDEEKIVQQENSIDELMENTKIRANTGVIQVEFNHHNNSTNEVDLGLVERAKAQTSLTKEVSNIKIVLSNEQVLFDTNKSVNNLYFSKHTEHGFNYKDNKLNSVPTINESKGEKSAEIIQAYMDSELIRGARIQLDYKMKVKNIGEVDYLDQKYYYTGLEDDPAKNIVKTTINKVIDYNSNSTVFKDETQKDSGWKMVEADYLLNNGLVSNGYKDELKTYKTILLNESMSGETIPEVFKNSYGIHIPSEYSTDLTMQADMGYKNIFSSLMYNNISEIVESKNMYGRKNEFSTPGNQELTDQRAVINAIQGKSTEDRMTPAEIDADSAQKVGILPPTGGKDYMLFTFIFTISLGLVLVGLFVIKGLVFNKKYVKNK